MRNENILNSQNEQSAFNKVIEENTCFVLTTHISPDGDGLGAMLALFHYLTEKQKKVYMVTADVIDAQYQFLPGVKSILHTLPPVQNYVLGAIDFSEQSRAGVALYPLFDSYTFLLNIDHHLNPQSFSRSLAIVHPHASSASEMMFYLLKDQLPSLSATVSARIAECLYVGIIYDTNNFTNKNVFPSTFNAAKILTGFDLDTNACSVQLFHRQSEKEIQLLGLTLASFQEFCDHRIGIFYTSRAMLKKVGASTELINGFSNKIKPAFDREIVVYLREIDANKIRASLRSQHVDIAKVATDFGGGGHKRAAGFQCTGTLDEIKNRLVDQLSFLV